MARQENCLASLNNKLNTRFIGRNILYYPSLSSTMDEARRLAKQGAAEGTAVLAEEQTAGRGRLGRRWLAPPGSSILLSLILHPSLKELPQLGMVAALAVVHTIEGLGIWHPVIKWPNDVLLEGKKVSGILIDSELERDRVLFAIAGIGLNVNFDPSSLPEIADIATSLSQKAGRELSRWELLPSLFQHFELLYQALRRGESLQQRWQSRLETLGKHIRVKVGERVEEGWAEATHEDGSLLLRRPDGTLTTLVSGEVTFHL